MTIQSPRPRTAHGHLERFVVSCSTSRSASVGSRDVFAHLPRPHGVVGHDVQEPRRTHPRRRCSRYRGSRPVGPRPSPHPGSAASTSHPGQVHRPGRDEVARTGFPSGHAELGVRRGSRGHRTEVDQDLDGPSAWRCLQARQGRSSPTEPAQVGVVSTDETDRCVSFGEEPAHLCGGDSSRRAQVTNPAHVVRALGRQGLEHVRPSPASQPKSSCRWSPPNEPRWRGGAVRVGAAWPTVAPTARHGESRMRTGRRRNAWAALVGAIAVAPRAATGAGQRRGDTGRPGGTAEKTVFTVGITQDVDTTNPFTGIAPPPRSRRTR